MSSRRADEMHAKACRSAHALLKIKDVMAKWSPAKRGKDYKPHLDLEIYELKLKRIARILRDLDRGAS